MKRKTFIYTSLVIALIFFLLSIFVADAPIHTGLFLSIFVGLVLTVQIEEALFGKKTTKSKKKPAAQATYPKPIYIRKHLDNGFVYRIEWLHGKQYVFDGFSNKYVYRIEGEKIYRGSETKVYYQLKGNRVYRAFDNKEPVYRIEGDKIYQGYFGTRPAFEISNKALR